MSCDLILGDCSDVLDSLVYKDITVDAIITSPPYDGLRQYDGITELWNFDKFKVIANKLYKILKNGGVLIWVVGDQTRNGSESCTSFKQVLYFREIGFKLHDTMIYRKVNYVPLNHNRYDQCFEYMFCLSKGKPKTFNPIKIPCKNAGKMEKYGMERRGVIDKHQSVRTYEDTKYRATKDTKYHSNIFEYTIGNEKTGHPAVFPIKLATDQIETWTNVDDLVLDPFMGSGTTGVACTNTNRNFIGIELNPRYFDMCKNRLGNK